MPAYKPIPTIVAQFDRYDLHRYMNTVRPGFYQRWDAFMEAVYGGDDEDQFYRIWRRVTNDSFHGSFARYVNATNEQVAAWNADLDAIWSELDIPDIIEFILLT